MDNILFMLGILNPYYWHPVAWIVVSVFVFCCVLADITTQWVYTLKNSNVRILSWVLISLFVLWGLGEGISNIGG